MEFDLSLFFRLYYVIATVGLAVTGWLVVLCPSRTPPLLYNLVVFGKLRTDDSLQFIDVPKRYFVHFYVVAAVCSSVAVACVSGSLAQFGVWQEYWHSIRLCASVTLLWIHCTRRLYESWFISVYAIDSRMNPLHYTLGLSYYFVLPVVMVLPFQLPQNDGLLNWQVALGSFLYVWATYHQHVTFRIFAALRKDASDRDAHLIPTGDLFRWVSCPHYFCECVLYMAFWPILGFSHRLWVYVLVFVLNNQLLCALMTHRWYKQSFGDKYPRSRRAIVPYLI